MVYGIPKDEKKYNPRLSIYKMTKTLSIIIPTFNSIKTIKRCLDSIFQQITELDYEVIIVDDESSDGTPDLIRGYIKDRSNFYLLEQPSGGAGIARNKGIEVAQGKYFLFLDSDDYLVQNALNIIGLELNANDLDVLTFAYRYYDESSCSLKEMRKRDADIYFNKKISGRVFEFSDYPELHGCTAYPWNKVYKRELLLENQIRFSETAVNNDLFVIIAAQAKAKKIKVIKDILCVHTIGPDIARVHLGNIFDKRRLDILTAFKQCEDFLSNENLSEPKKVPYYLLKISLLVWIIPRTAGSLRQEFETYTESFIDSLPRETISRLMSNETVVNSWVKEYIKRRGLLGKCIPCISDLQSGEQLLSIIVSVYNSETNLGRCLQSIANQILDARLFEVIIVDNKLTDASLAVCRRFCQRYSHFKMIALPKHAPDGIWDLHDFGLRQARGRYLGIISGNDFVVPSMFEKLVEKGLETDSDVVLCDFSGGTVSGGYEKREWKALIRDNLAGDLHVEYIKRRILHLSPVTGRAIYKKSFIVGRDIHCREENYLQESVVLHWCSTVTANSFAFIDKCLLSHQKTEETPEKLMSYISSGQTIVDFLKENGLFDKYKTEFILWMTEQSNRIIPMLGAKKKSYIKGLKKVLSWVTIADLQECKKVAQQRKATLIYNFFLVHGHHGTGATIRGLITHFRR